MYQRYSNIEEYFALKKINKSLIDHNKKLIKQTPYSFLKTDQNIFEFNDTLYKRQYTYINAKVINNSINRRNNYLTLNKGRSHGVDVDMGVITPSGVIGIVKNVSSNFSSVISLLHTDVRISAKIKKNNHIGTLIWNSPNYRKVSMVDIPPHVNVEIGDTIATSGFSTIFPENIPIGLVSNYDIKRGENFLTIDVELFQDFNNLYNVFVIKNLFGKEQKELEEETIKEAVSW